MKRWTAIVVLGLVVWLGFMVIPAGSSILGIEPVVYAPAVFKPVNTPTPTATPTTPPATATPTTAPATNTPTATATNPPGNTGNVQIVTIWFDGTGSEEPDEYVQIQNLDTISIQLNGWTLSDQANHVFTFPSFVLAAGQTCRIYTNENHPEWCGFNYQSGSGIWNNGGDCGTLRNSSNVLIDEYCY